MNSINAVKSKCQDRLNKAYIKIKCLKDRFCDPRGEQIDTAVKIIIGVVVGALVLTGFITLWSNVIMPRLNSEVNEMFNA